MDRYQSTVREKITIVGIGLHSGRDVRMEILPSEADTGIVFRRTDSTGALPVSAHPFNVSNTDLCTTIGSGSSAISTIEHLMAAFAGLGIDNAIVEVDAPELPILDGSAAPFVDRIMSTGIRKVRGSRRLYIVEQPLEVRDGDRFMRIEPARRLRFHCSIDFEASIIGKQSIDFAFSRSAFLKLSQSRTFCHLREVEAMRKAGLALGGSLQNAVVVTDEGILNHDGLRSHDEFVRHKLLDCIGDLALLGSPMVGKITINKPGHCLHAKFMVELLKRKSEVLTLVDLGELSRERQIPLSETQMALSTAATALYG